MQNGKMVLDLNCSEMWMPERGHSKQMEGEQGNIEWIMIWFWSCSGSTLAASWVLSGLEVSLQRWVSRRNGEVDSVVNASDVGRTFTSLVHKGLWTVETADRALGLSQHYHAVRMFIWTNHCKRLSHAYLNIKDSEAFKDRRHHFSWPSGCNRGHGITVTPASGPRHLGWITAALLERYANLIRSLQGSWSLTFIGPVYVVAQHVKYSKYIFLNWFWLLNGYKGFLKSSGFLSTIVYCRGSSWRLIWKIHAGHWVEMCPLNDGQWPRKNFLSARGPQQNCFMSASVWLSSLNGNSAKGLLLSFGLHLKCLPCASNAHDSTQT